MAAPAAPPRSPRAAANGPGGGGDGGGGRGGGGYRTHSSCQPARAAGSSALPLGERSTQSGDYTSQQAPRPAERCGTEPLTPGCCPRLPRPGRKLRGNSSLVGDPACATHFRTCAVHAAVPTRRLGSCAARPPVSDGRGRWWRQVVYSGGSELPGHRDNQAVLWMGPCENTNTGHEEYYVGLSEMGIARWLHYEAR
nr:motor neuron and pancreas homeobox protein 1-like [Macaca fascicularis]